MKTLHYLKTALTLLVAGCVLLTACVPAAETPPPTPASDAQFVPTATQPPGTATPVPIPSPLKTPAAITGPRTSECLAQGEFPPLLPGVRYGINAFLFGTDTERVLTLADNAGFTWIRQQIHWRDVNGDGRHFVWASLDQAVRMARQQDMHILLSIVRSPGWATADGGDGLPEDPATLAEFLHTLATRYRGKVSAYQVWNEPNLSHENGGMPAQPSAYLPVLEAAYTAIKDADPCALVLSAALASTNNPDPALATADLPFFEELYTLNDGAFLRSADVIAVHPGAGPYPPTARWPDDQPERSSFYLQHIERLREIMLRYGDTRQVWITELGWSTDHAIGAPPPVSQQQQADYLAESLWYIRHTYPWIAAVFVWNLNFSVIGSPDDEKSTFGLLNPDWSVRPGYLALQREVTTLHDLDKPPFITPDAAYTFAWSFPGRGKMRTRPLLSPQGNIYVASDPGHLYALTPTGALRWSFDAPGSTSRAPAQAPDGTLYLGSLGVLTTLTPDGNVVRETRLRGRIQGSPIYHDGTIYTVARDGEVQAFDAASGQEIWWTDLHMVATPLALDTTDRSQPALIALTIQGDVHKLSADGQLVWRTELGKPGEEFQAAPAAGPGPDGQVYVASTSGRVVALDTEGQIMWEQDMGAVIVAPPLVGNNGFVYIAARDGTLSALRTQDGTINWRFATGSDMVAPPARGADGMLYVGTDDERLLALTASGTLDWQAHVRGMVRSQPTLAPDGTLYISTVGGRVYAFRPVQR